MKKFKLNMENYLFKKYNFGNYSEFKVMKYFDD